MELEKKRKLLSTARKAHTHLGKVIAMLENDEYCVPILQQALAVQGLWKRTIRQIFQNHLQTCFSSVMCHGEMKEQERVLRELARVMELADRS